MNTNERNLTGKGEMKKDVTDELEQLMQKRKLQNKVLKRIVDKLNDDTNVIPGKTNKE